jgi:hypothetical protein
MQSAHAAIMVVLQLLQQVGTYDTVTSVTPKFLPVFIECDESERDGTVNGTSVRVVSYNVVDLLIEKPAAFNRKHGGDVRADEQARLRGFLELIDAVRGEKNTKLRDVAHYFASLADDPDLWDKIQADPVAFVQKEINDRTGGASIVVWRERTGRLSAGIFCDGGMLDAVYVLSLFRIGIGPKGGTGSCVICGKTVERTRGDRRKTCSDKCRKRASRMKALGLRPGIRHHRSAT